MKTTIIKICLLALFLSGCNNNQEAQEATNQTEKITNTTVEIPKESSNTIDKPGENETDENTKEKVFEYFENKDYATDGKNIYINAYDGGSSYSKNYQIAKNIDVETFQLLGGNYFKDRNGVYYNTRSGYELENNIKIITNVDAETTNFINDDCLKDKDAIYCDAIYIKAEKNISMKIVEEADPETFKYVDGYFRDKNYIFCNKFEKGIDIQKLDNADADSFEIIDGKFARDKSAVFYLCNRLKNSDPNTFEILERTMYQKDKNNVYFESWIIENADPNSFEIFNLFITKDKNAVYYSGKRVNEIEDPNSFEITEDFHNGKDKYFNYYIVKYADERGLVVNKTPIEK